jgi:hypothetical protein
LSEEKSPRWRLARRLAHCVAHLANAVALEGDVRWSQPIRALHKGPCRSPIPLGTRMLHKLMQARQYVKDLIPTHLTDIVRLPGSSRSAVTFSPQTLGHILYVGPPVFPGDWQAQANLHIRSRRGGCFMTQRINFCHKRELIPSTVKYTETERY